MKLRIHNRGVNRNGLVTVDHNRHTTLNMGAHVDLTESIEPTRARVGYGERLANSQRTTTPLPRQQGPQ